MKIELLKYRKLILSIVTMVILMGGYYFIKEKETKTLRLLKDTFLVEYGEIILTDNKEYLDFTGMEDSVKKDINKKAKFSIDKNIQKEYPEIGKYLATIVYKQESISFTILVQDTTSPSFNPVEDSSVPRGTMLTSQQIRDKFVVHDLQATKVEVEEGGYDGNKLGKYTIKAIARDATGNIANASYCLTVEEKDGKTGQEKLPVNNDNKSNGDKSNGDKSSDDKSSDDKSNNDVSVKEPINGDSGKQEDPNVGPPTIEPPAQDKPNDQTDWWGSLSDQEIRNRVIPSLVWKNEWNNTIYKGIEGLTYGFNIEDKAYGGLVLVENPYDVQIDFGFYGGPYCQTDTNTFALYWQAPKGPGREVDCGKMKIDIPPPITGEELYNHYQ